MTIIQLEYFIAVANYGSFSAAAEHCFVTQPSLSMQIRNLEEELGVILLDRNNKPIVTTEAGRVVMEQAKEAIAAFYGTKERVNEMKGDFSGKLRLGIIPTISPYLLPKFLPKFAKRFPKVNLDIRDLFTAGIIDYLNRDMIDIAILSGGDPIKIEETNLFEDKLYFYVSPRGRFYDRSSVFIEDIDVNHLLMLSEGNCLRNQALKAMCLAKHKVEALHDYANCSLETLMRMVDVSSDGVTIITGMMIDYIPKERHKQIKPFGKVKARRKITMSVARVYVKEVLVNAVKESLIEVANENAIADFVRS